MSDILMPALSPTMTEGTLARWLVKEGDEVASGDVIAEIETDKALMEVEAVDDGTVIRLLVAEGTAGVKVGAVIAEISGDEGNDGAGTASPPSPSSTTAPSNSTVEPSPATPPSPAQPEAVAKDKSGNRLFATPLARRIASQKGIDLAQIKGTGPNGRIIRADVDETPVPETPVSQIPITTPTPTADTGVPDTGVRSSIIANSPMRMVIAERLQKSWQETPHFFVNMEIALDALLEARKTLNANAPDGVKISVNDMLIKAASLALIKHPRINSGWEGAHIRQHHHADIAIAVALEDGLITPIIWQAEQKGIYAIASEARSLASRGREGKLAPSDYTGGSFTISNLGMAGVDHFTAIINPPHSAILAIGAGVEKPVVRNGTVAIATMMSVSLACDHRVINGAEGAEWLGSFRRFVENPILALG